MTVQIISSGAVTPSAAGIGDYLYVEGGGTAVSAAILGGTEVVSGADSAATVTDRGNQGIFSGGTATSTVVGDGAVQTIRSGGTALSALVISTGSQLVSKGAIVSETAIGPGGLGIVSAGGTALDAAVSAGGLEILRGYSFASGGSSVSVPASAVGLTIDSGGAAVISAEGTVSGGTVGSGGLLFAYSGSTLSGVTVSSGGYLLLAPGAEAVAMQGAGSVISTGVVTVQPGSGTTDLGSQAAGLTFGSGVQAFILPGGRVSGGSLISGASEQVFSGGTASGQTVSDSFQVISNGGLATGSILADGAVEDVFSGGSAAGTVLDSAFAFVDLGGSATDITVNAGGNETLDGSVTGTTLNSGGAQFVMSNGLATSTTVNSGAYAFVISGTVSAMIIGGGGYAVLSGGLSLEATVASGGTLVGSNATAIGTTVESGGLMVLLPAETDSGTVVDSGGTLIILPGASASYSAAAGADIISGGAVVVVSGGTTAAVAPDSAAVIGSGNTGYVLSGATESGAIIANHGSAEVESGGTAVDTTILAGGMLTIRAGATVAGAVTFSGISATLKTGEPALPGAVISGFAPGDSIDLTTFSGSSPSATLLSGNILDVQGGSASTELQLDPAQNYAGDTFAAATGSNGDTIVTVKDGTAPTGGSVAGSVTPVDIPLYLVPYGSGYKVGIEVSLDGGATYKMVEFDTGASGFFAGYDPSWWSSYSLVAQAPTVMSYASGNAYTAEVVSTNVTVQTTGAPLTVGDVNVGLIASAVNPGAFTPQGWNADLASTPSVPPLDGAFYGDFGMGLGSNDGIEAVLAQLDNGLSNGFIITLGEAPDGNTGQIGTLQLGLTQADIDSYNTSGAVIPMQGQNTLDPFPGSDEPSYTKILGSGTLNVGDSSNGMVSLGAGFVYDTGAPEMDIHEGSSAVADSLAPYVQSGSDGGLLSSGTTVELNAPGTGSDWNFGLTTANQSDADTVGLTDDSGETYVNASINAFFGESVMFDIADGTLGFQAMPCFAAGTHIATPTGEVAVERLRVGEVVTTITGEARPIRWIGNRTVDCRRHPSPEAVLPVRVTAHAFGPGLPRRDLHLSPDHALFLEDALIPVKYLLDGAAVAQIPTAWVTYYHLELESHDVILAEGLPAETYLETGQRAAFSNGGTVIRMHPDFAAEPDSILLCWDALGYAPLVVSGPALDRAKQRLGCARQKRRHRA